MKLYDACKSINIAKEHVAALKRLGYKVSMRFNWWNSLYEIYIQEKEGK